MLWLPLGRGSGWRKLEWDILLWQQRPLKSAEPWSVNSPSESSRNHPDSFYKANTWASICPLPEICQDHVSDDVHSSNSNQSPFGSGSFLTRWAEQNKLNIWEGQPFVKQSYCQAWLAVNITMLYAFQVLHFKQYLLIQYWTQKLLDLRRCIQIEGVIFCKCVIWTAGFIISW